MAELTPSRQMALINYLARSDALWSLNHNGSPSAQAAARRALRDPDARIREVVAQFNRRNRLQLAVTDPALGERPIGGTFAADNAEGFVRLLESSGAAAVERRGEFELLLRPAR